MRAFSLALLLVCASASAQTTHTVIVRSFSFTPATLSVETGDTVRWVNESGSHNIAQLSGPETFGRAQVGAGWTYEFTFNEVGTSTYQCDPHSGSMQGAITVRPTTSTEELPDGTSRLDLASENPFSGSVRLTLTLADAEDVRVAVYDARGREVDVIHDGLARGGATDLTWTSDAARPGIYVIRAIGEGLSLSQGVSLAGASAGHAGGH